LIFFDKVDRSRQKSIWLDGVEYLIQTDFCYWIAFEKIINKSQSYDEFDFLYTGGQKLGMPKDKEAGLLELIKFYRNEQPLPRDLGDNLDVEVINWITDSEYIYAAFLSQYRIDLIKQELHWHDFLSLFRSLKGHTINDIMAYRSWMPPKEYKTAKAAQEADNKEYRLRKQRWEIEKKKTEPFVMK